jgi:hypothetical protein
MSATVRCTVSSLSTGSSSTMVATHAQGPLHIYLSPLNYDKVRETT